MLPRSVSRDAVRRIRIGSAEARQRAIDAARARGLTVINGVPVEEFFSP